MQNFVKIGQTMEILQFFDLQLCSYPPSWICGAYSAKFGWNSFSSFDNKKVWIFCTFGWKMLIHAPFGVFRGKNEDNGHFLHFIPLEMQQPGIDIVWIKPHKNWFCIFSLGTQAKFWVTKKQTTNHAIVIFHPYAGRDAPLRRFFWILAWGNITNVITHAKFHVSQFRVWGFWHPKSALLHRPKLLALTTVHPRLHCDYVVYTMLPCQIQNTDVCEHKFTF